MIILYFVSRRASRELQPSVYVSLQHSPIGFNPDCAAGAVAWCLYIVFKFYILAPKYFRRDGLKFSILL